MISPYNSDSKGYQEILKQEIVQIEKDLDRTYNEHKYFGENGKGKQQLQELLQILTMKYSWIGYVQGMNYLCAAVLYHSQP